MQQDTPEIILVRVFNAPRPLVFRAWTDARFLADWWAPAGFTNPVCEIDPRVGGTIHIVMRDADGSEFPMRGSILEFEPPERMIYADSALHDDQGMPRFEALTEVTFEDLGDSTRVTVWSKVERFSPDIADSVGGMEQGWSESLEKLATLLNTHDGRMA